MGEIYPSGTCKHCGAPRHIEFGGSSCHKETPSCKCYQKYWTPEDIYWKTLTKEEKKRNREFQKKQGLIEEKRVRPNKTVKAACLGCGEKERKIKVLEDSYSKLRDKVNEWAVRLDEYFCYLNDKVSIVDEMYKEVGRQ